MKKQKRWQVVLGAIVAMIVVARFKIGRPLGPVAVEAIEHREVWMLLLRVAVFNFALAVLGFLPLAVSVWWVSASRRMSARWQTWFSGKAYKLREYWSVPLALLCGFALFKRHSLAGLASEVVGLACFWAIGPGMVMYRSWLCDQQKKKERENASRESALTEAPEAMDLQA